MAGLASFKEMKRETQYLVNKKKVYVFWDIDNVRPKKNSNVLSFVGNVRNRFVGDLFEAGFIVVCDVRKEPKELVDQLNELQVHYIINDDTNTVLVYFRFKFSMSVETKRTHQMRFFDRKCEDLLIWQQSQEELY